MYTFIGLNDLMKGIRCVLVNFSKNLSHLKRTLECKNKRNGNCKKLNRRDTVEKQQDRVNVILGMMLEAGVIEDYNRELSRDLLTVLYQKAFEDGTLNGLYGNN